MTGDTDDIGEVLRAHGIRPGPRGYTRAQFVGAAAARDWSVSVEEVPRATRWTRWRALVRGSLGSWPRRPLVARGRGASAEAALAVALAAALVSATGGDGCAVLDTAAD